jgi:hypothetical protein
MEWVLLFCHTYNFSVTNNNELTFCTVGGKNETVSVASKEDFEGTSGCASENTERPTK